MIQKVGWVIWSLVGITLLVGVGSATQVTLSNSQAGQSIVFTGTTTGETVNLVGTGGFCGSTNRCVSGYGLYGSTLGHYTMSITGADPTLGTPTLDTYPVINGNEFNFTFSILGSTLNGTWNFTDLSGGSTRAPEFIGTFDVSKSSTGIFAVWGGQTLNGDFTVNLQGTKTVSKIFANKGESTTGGVSSGEIIPAVPEPASLGLVGSGLLAMAGLLKRRLR